MEFILKPDNRNSSDEDLIYDLIKVANQLGKESVSRSEYEKYGRYSSSTLMNRFGGWNKTIKKSGLKHISQYGITKEDLILEIKRIAKLLNKNSITREEFTLNKKISNSSTVERLFGTWTNGLKEAGIEIERTQKRNSKEDFFENLLVVWTHYERQPSISEMNENPSKISAGSYRYRFGSWRNALESFIEYINKEEKILEEENKEVQAKILKEENQEYKKEDKHKTSRTINLRFRFIVMKRDNFKCKMCGRNPAKDTSIILHVDHIKPYANGGETVLENLQTLCSICNIGKSNLE